MQMEQSHNSTIVLLNLKTNVIHVLITQGYQAFKINLPMYILIVIRWEIENDEISVGLGSISIKNFRQKIT